MSVVFPEPDRKEIRLFVETMFRHADPGTFVSLRAFRDDADGTWGHESWSSPKIEETAFSSIIAPAAELAEACARAPVPVVFAPPVATFKTANGAAEKDIANGLELCVECDAEPAAARERLENLIGPATLVVASGGSWINPNTGEAQDKLHLHWRLTKPTREFADHVKLKESRRLAKSLVGADSSAVPLVHPLRWPGSYHRKGKPRLAQIVQLRGDTEIDLSDTFERLKDAAVDRRQKEPGGGAQNDPGEGQKTAELIATILRAEDYHGPIAQLAMRFLKGGMADAQAVETLRGIMLAVDPGRRDYKGGTVHKDRWLSRYNDIPRAVRSARAKIDQPTTPGPAAPWPAPVLLLVRELEAAMPFPVNFLPGPLAEFACDVADRMQCPLDFIAVPLIIQAATLIGKEFRLAPKGADDWIERSCLWGGVIAPSAAMKSPAFHAALAPIRWLQSEFHKQHEKDIENHQAILRQFDFEERRYKETSRKAAKTGKEMPPAPQEPPDPPKMRRLLTDDPTVEALVELMQNNPRGLLLFRDELSAWFASFNQYRPGADRQFYLECHSGGAHFKDRKSGVTIVDDLYLNICGGVQPEIINKVLAGGDLDGMTPRFGLLVWPDRDEEFHYIDRQPNSSARHKTEAVLKKLLEFAPHKFFGPGYAPEARALRFDDAAQPIFTEWYKKNQARIRSANEKSGFLTHLGKYPGLFARLAIVHHLIRYALADNTASPTLVDEISAGAVESFIDDYLESHARRIYQHLGDDPTRQGARRIAQWIFTSPQLTDFTARDVRRKEWSNLTTQDSVNASLDYLENVAGWVRSKTDLPGPRGGRPSTQYLINPRLERKETCV
jgi:hypothetical protein